ncbi:lytic transglycosylase domain-containing protein [bacterium]|nr:MAG: lytic transglycosylase domain-containing protein [bacterium]
MRSVFILALPLLAAGARAADEPGLAYIRKVKAYGVKGAVTADALNNVKGTAFFDVRGVTNGSLRMENGAGILIGAKSGPIMVDTPSVPEWLVAETEVRLLVRAERAEEYGEVRIFLIAAAPQAVVGAAEAIVSSKAAKAVAKAPSKPANIAQRGHRQAARREWVLAPNDVTPIYAQFIRKQNSKLSDREANRIAASVINYSLRYGVDARLVMAILMVESGFDPGATSRSGAMGLGQLMPGTARWMGVRNAYDSVDNLYGCIKLLSVHLRDYRAKGHAEDKVLRLALAAYNAGAGAVRRHGGVPPYRETQRYVVKVLGLYYAFLGA